MREDRVVDQKPDQHQGSIQVGGGSRHMRPEMLREVSRKQTPGIDSRILDDLENVIVDKAETGHRSVKEIGCSENQEHPDWGRIFPEVRCALLRWHGRVCDHDLPVRIIRSQVKKAKAPDGSSGASGLYFPEVLCKSYCSTDRGLQVAFTVIGAD